MSSQGWVKLYRQIQQSIVWTDSDQLKLWLLLLLKANHSDSKFLFNGEQISLTSGQLVTGAHVLASEFNQGVKRDNRVTWRTLWRWVKRFENQEMLTIESSSKYSVISITGWGQYQSDDNQVTIAGQSSDNRVTTNKNDKNDKEENTTSSGGDGKPKVEQNFELLWKLYPRKEGKDVARKAYKRAIKNGATNKEIQDGIVAYRKLVASEGRDKQYIRQGGTWFNHKGWEDEYQTELPVDTSEQSEQSATDMNDLDRQQEENLRRAEEKYRKEHPELNE